MPPSHDLPSVADGRRLPRKGQRPVQFERFLSLLRALERERVEYALVGAVAMNLHGIARATEDVDLFIRPERENVQRLTRALRSMWDDTDIDQITLEDLSGEYPMIRYGPPGEDFVIDLMSRLGDTFHFGDIETERMRVEDAEVRIATPRMLYRMKKDTVGSLTEPMPPPCATSSSSARSNMPVQRFRSFEDARRAFWLAPGDPKLLARIRSLWEFSARLAPCIMPRGVHKFCSIEEANQDRDLWTQRRIRSLRATRLRSRSGVADP